MRAGPCPVKAAAERSLAIDTSLPAALARIWPAHLSKPCNIRRLAGLGVGQVFSAHLGSRPAIIKITPCGRERWFYQHLAHPLAGCGISAPLLLWAGSLPTAKSPERSVIVLEKIPRLLPKARWRADPGTLATLARLHSCTAQGHLPPGSKVSGKHGGLKAESWPAAMNEEAAQLFAKAEQAHTVLEQARRRSRAFLAPEHIVSGDPNGSNWGLRRTGQLVLFDWERVGLGSAALDLAGVAYGEPDDDEFTAIARLYLSFRPGYGQLVRELVAKIKLARLYFAALLLSRHQRGQQALPPAVLGYYRGQFLAWARRAVG